MPPAGIARNSGGWDGGSIVRGAAVVAESGRAAPNADRRDRADGADTVGGQEPETESEKGFGGADSKSLAVCVADAGCPRIEAERPLATAPDDRR
jgi:hypothetical protein